MPVYDYRNLNTGKTETLIKPVDERDDVPPHLERVTVPDRVNIVGNLPMVTLETKTQGALKDIEEQIGAAGIERETGFSCRELKKHWYSEEEHPEPLLVE